MRRMKSLDEMIDEALKKTKEDVERFINESYDYTKIIQVTATPWTTRHRLKVTRVEYYDISKAKICYIKKIKKGGLRK